MKVKAARLHLKNLRSITLDEWESDVPTDVREVFVSVSGYETRCTEWPRAIKTGAKRTWIVLGFTEMRTVLSRPRSDLFYRERGSQVVDFSRDDSEGILSLITDVIRAEVSQESPLHIHVDYSCMPRKWYCSLPLALEGVLRTKDRAYFWYTAGHYSTAEYPTAGVSDFHIFAGRASLSARYRTHVFGLGFDRIRANAICSVLDPQYLVCFYSDPGVRQEYVDKVKTDNADILRQANLTFTIPINDFNATFTRLCAIANEFRQLGDVVFVPDGPKPLVLASSLVPLVVRGGILCFHVARRKGKDYQPVDVSPVGEFYGFTFDGVL